MKRTQDKSQKKILKWFALRLHSFFFWIAHLTKFRGMDSARWKLVIEIDRSASGCVQFVLICIWWKLKILLLKHFHLQRNNMILPWPDVFLQISRNKEWKTYDENVFEINLIYTITWSSRLYVVVSNSLSSKTSSSGKSKYSTKYGTSSVCKWVSVVPVCIR